MAQQDGYNVISQVIACPEGVGDDHSECIPDIDVTVEYYSTSGESFGSCATRLVAPIPGAQAAICSVVVPFNTTVVISQDTSTIEPGYVPTQDSITFETPKRIPDGPREPDVFFVNVQEGGTDEPITDLPDTGTAPLTGGGGMLAGLLTVLAGVCALAGALLRRRSMFETRRA